MKNTGRVPIYKTRIESLTPEDGWVRLTTHTNQSSVTQFRARYPGYEFRSRKNPDYEPGNPNEKQYIFEASAPEPHDSGETA